MLVVTAVFFLSYLPFSTARDWFLLHLYWCNHSICQNHWVYVTSIWHSRAIYLILCSFLRSTDIQRQLVGEMMQNVSSY